MYSLGYDLIVDDDGLVEEAEKLMAKINCFELQLGELADVLRNAACNAVMEGNTADNLAGFMEEVQNLREEARTITEQLTSTVHNYVESMDEADSYVY